MVSFHFEALCSLCQPAHVLAARANRPTGKQSGDNHRRDEQERPRCRPGRGQRVAAMKAPTSMTAEASRERRRDSWTATVYSATRSDASPMSRYPNAHCPRAMADTTQKTAVGRDAADEWSEKRQLYPGLVPVEGSGMDEPCSGQRQEDRCERGVGRDHVSVRYPAKVLEQGTARLTCTRQGGGRQVDWAVEAHRSGLLNGRLLPVRVPLPHGPIVRGREIYDLWMSLSNIVLLPGVGGESLESGRRLRAGRFRDSRYSSFISPSGSGGTIQRVSAEVPDSPGSSRGAGRWPRRRGPRRHWIKRRWLRRLTVAAVAIVVLVAAAVSGATPTSTTASTRPLHQGQASRQGQEHGAARQRRDDPAHRLDLPLRSQRQAGRGIRHVLLDGPPGPPPASPGSTAT